jgi:threonine synthase
MRPLGGRCDRTPAAGSVRAVGIAEVSRTTMLRNSEAAREEAGPDNAPSPGSSAAPLNGSPDPEDAGLGISPLLDAVDVGAVTFAHPIEAARRISADPTRPLDERLAYYEDVFESEVGDTGLSRARNVEREVGLRQVYLKFEGDNPSGTQKDRIAFAQAMDALRRGFDAITVATCGNYGVAIALASSLGGLRCVIFVPQNYSALRVKEMERYGAEVRREPGDYESVVEASRQWAAACEVYDANAGGANTPLQLRVYGEIAYEIYDELGDAPAAVAVPVSNGTTLAGIHRGFVSLYRRGKTSRIPRMIAGSSHGKNPIVRAFVKNLPRCENLRPDKIRETSVNEPLINWSSIDGDHALGSIRATGGWASFVSDRSMLQYSRLIRDHQGLAVLPASTAGLIALVSTPGLVSDRYVVILTGRRS